MASQDDRAGAQKRPRMAIPPEAPPGIEQDAKGNLIPFAQRTEEDRERARGGGAKAGTL
jgi:hypothetical protein